MGQRNKQLKDSNRDRNQRSSIKSNALSARAGAFRDLSKSKEKLETNARSIGGIQELALQKIEQNKNQDLKTLVNELTSETGYKRDRVLQRLIELVDEKKITLQEKFPYKSILSYAISPYSLWFWGALFATIFSLALVSVTGGVVLYLRYVFGGLLILFLPGYSLVEFLYAKKKELEGLTRLALSIGLSLAIVPLVGLALNYTPFGIRLVPVALSLTFVTLILLILALRKKHSYYKIAKDII